MSDVLLEMRGITKEFPGVKALKEVTFSVRPGEIHALVGENGAGKSTLMKVVSGVYPYGTYDGEFFFKGEECRFHSIRESEHKGIVIIHQELALVPHLSITENIFLANEQATRGVINWSKSHAKAIELLKKVGLHETPDTKISHLGVGKQQLVEIAKALSKDVELLILDEPTSSLNENDSQALLQLLREFRANGIACVLISHKLKEVESVADTITVLRDGAVIESLDASTGDVTEDRIIRGMVGRDMTHRFPPRESNIGEVLLEVRNWKVRHPVYDDRMVINDVSLNVRAGEVVGIAGLMGAGRTEFAMSVFGRSYGHFVSGQVLKHGKEIDVSTIPKAVANGIAYATEDRKTYGLVLMNDVKTNITMANLEGVSNRGVLIPPKEITVANEFRDALNIKTPSVTQITVNLSGGTQQKVVLGKWLALTPRVLILDEPTRGIDVGAKAEIYRHMAELAAQGLAILMISSEMEEVLGMSDRVVVMHERRVRGIVPRAGLTAERVAALMTGQAEAAAV